MRTISQTIDGAPADLRDTEPIGTVNRMVQHQVLDRTFAALSDGTRRDILTRLSHGPASISALAQPFAMSLTGLKKHVQVLEEARLVTTEKVGRTRMCRLAPGHLDEAAQWVDVLRSRWDRKLDGLEAYLADKKADKKKGRAR